METLARSANRGSISTGGYEIANSLKFERDNAERMSRVITSTTNRRTWTWSGWVKRTNLIDTDVYGHILWKFGVDGSDYVGAIRFMNDDTVRLELGSDGVSTFYRIQTTRKFRDTSAWYHLVLAVDTTQATDTNRVKFYVNGVQETNFSSSTYPPQNFDTLNNYTQSSSSVWVYGGYAFPTTYGQANFYLAETNHIDGSQLAPTDFGEFDADTGIWKPIEYTGSYGTNGWYLNFSNSSALGEDFSGNNLDWTTFNNITSADQATDTPTNNFCTQSAVATFLNRTPQTRHAADGGSASEDASVTNAWTGAVGTVALFKGKWYWELQGHISTNSMSGIHSFVGDTGSSTLSPHQSDNSFFVVHNNGSNVSALGKTINGTTTYPISTGNEFTHLSIVGIALDLDNSLMTYYINGGSAGTNLTDIDISDITDFGDPIMPFVSIYRYRIRTNFGGYVETAWGTGETDANGYGNFKYSVPSGYYAICSKNLAEFG